jgi:hypothetical protein
LATGSPDAVGAGFDGLGDGYRSQLQMVVRHQGLEPRTR